MKTYDYRGSVIKEGNKTTSIAYVQCACGCLASRVSSDLDKYKCSLCKRIYTIKKNSIMRNHKLYYKKREYLIYSFLGIPVYWYT